MEKSMSMRLDAVIIIASLFWSAIANADLEVILAEEFDLPYALSPSKYANSPSKYSNSLSKYSNSKTKYSNSSAKYDNSPSKSSNSPSGSQRLLLKQGNSYFYIGYYVWGDEGLLNFFSPAGDRIFYSPPETDAIFDSEEGEFAGALARIRDESVLVVTEKGQLALAKSGISLSESANGQKNSAVDTYQIEFAHNDEIFVINGEAFEAKIFCLGWDVGDSVIFIDGSPYGACVSAELFNTDRKESCEVWCE